MKTRDIFILFGAFIFSFLFYQQSAGINYAIFNLFLFIGLAVIHPQNIREKRGLLAVAALLLSSVSIVLYGNLLAYISCLVSWLLLSGVVFKPKHSVILNFTQAICAYVFSIPALLKGWAYNPKLQKRFEGSKADLIPAYIIVFAIVFLFIIIYSQTSKAFGLVLQSIDLSFLSFVGILYTLLGFVVCAALLRHRRLKFLDRLEPKWAAPLIALLPPYTAEYEGKLYSERKAGWLLLLLLDIILLTVNISDIVFLAGFEIGETQVNYPEMVHQGIGALIFSIVLAVAILLFFFRGQLNFDSKAKGLYQLALVWVALNLVLVITSALKNGAYIAIDEGLTYKRIGVYYFLGLSVIGLLFTAYKLMFKKPNWYLLRVNFTVFIGVLVASSLINWDAFITRYNIEKAIADREDPNIFYLQNLSHHALPQLINWVDEVRENPATIHQLKPKQVEEYSYHILTNAQWFVEKYETIDWQSRNYYDQKTYDYLKTLGLKDKIYQHHLQYNYALPNTNR